MSAEMSFADWLTTRHSTRKFTDQSVSRSLIERILEIATRAPNAHNRQPWRFVVLTSKERRTQLAKSMEGEFQQVLIEDGLANIEIELKIQASQKKIVNAGAVILVCYDSEVMDTHKDLNRNEGEFMIGAQSVAMAGGQLLLGAHALGLGGVWICSPLFAQKSVMEELNLESTWYPQGLVLLGYPAGEVKKRKRKPIESVSIFLD